MTTPLVELRGITKHYGTGETRVVAVDGIDLAVHRGEVVGLLGPSGSGKTTLLNIIGCIAEPSAGHLALDGEALWDGKWRVRDLRRLRRDKVGFIFQSHNLVPFLSALDNVALAQRLTGLGQAASRERARELLRYLEVEHRQAAKPAQLSGGEAQRVAIARALANRPKIILADEPTAALDGDRAAIVMDLLRRVAAEQGAAVLVVTHDEKIFGRFDRFLALRDGKAAEQNQVLRPEAACVSTSLTVSA